MTRSTLLQLLAHPAALSGADVRELEQLAQAFPYCQTAHLLLAKAAHDQGSMLAGQRLRRAATYATDRARLRQLIEQSAPAVVAAAPPPAAPEPGPTPPEVAPPVLPEPAREEAPAEDAAPEIAPAAEVAPAAPLVADPFDLVIPELPAAAAPAPDAELPAQAPPIRPPAEAAARFEYGLADAEPAEIMAYQLPELLEAEQAPDSLAAAPGAATAALPPPAFAGVADVGYAPGEGSRLGFCLQSPAAEHYSLTAGPAALLPSAQLPPASEFFAPDALLLAHLAAHQAPAAPASSPIASDLINSFLKRAPQATKRRRTPPPLPEAEEEEQPDLSGPSTRAVPDLASENLAKILVRQGKPDRAIAIYERLMVKHPEKMAYFAAQIDSLRPPA